MKYYVTITGLSHRYGVEPFQAGQKVRLIKEPENQYDHEAIRAELPGLGKVGYVANSVHTVVGECCSAGRIYDKMADQATAKVRYGWETPWCAASSCPRWTARNCLRTRRSRMTPKRMQWNFDFPAGTISSLFYN